MKNLRHLVIALCVIPMLALTSSAHALDCTVTVKAIQVQNDQITLIQFPNNTWHVLSSTADSTTTRTSLLSIANAALLSGKSIFISYPSGSCSTTDYGTHPSRTRLLQ